MVVTDDDDLAARMRLLRSHGMTTLTWDRHRGHAVGYDVVALGFNYRIDEPRAALATPRLARLDDENRRRAPLDARYRERLAGVDGVEPTRRRRRRRRVPAHHLFTVVLDAGDRPRRAAQRARRAAASRRACTTRRRTASRSTRTAAAELPLTDAYGARAVTLPLFAHMTDEQQDSSSAPSVSSRAPCSCAAPRPPLPRDPGRVDLVNEVRTAAGLVRCGPQAAVAHRAGSLSAGRGSAPRPSPATASTASASQRGIVLVPARPRDGHPRHAVDRHADARERRVVDGDRRSGAWPALGLRAPAGALGRDDDVGDERPDVAGDRAHVVGDGEAVGLRRAGSGGSRRRSSVRRSGRAPRGCPRRAARRSCW